MVGPGGFEPPSTIPKTVRIDHYPTGLKILLGKKRLLDPF